MRKGKTRVRVIWNGMKQRCYSPNTNNAKYYHDKGITICDEWKDNFQAFYDWALLHGYRDDLTIDRINSDGNYCPENCRWLSLSENASRASLNRKPKPQPQSDIPYEIRKQMARTIRTILEENTLPHMWLVARLADEGIDTCTTTLRGVLSQSVSGPKMDEILVKSEEICKRYQKKMGRCEHEKPRNDLI